MEEQQPVADNPPGRAPGLLLALQHLEERGVRERRRQQPPQQGPKAQSRKVRELGEGEKIYDLYFWDDVLQEEGHGGKVVVCQVRNSERPGHFPYVMKIKSKESLRGSEEQFRRSQERMLNLLPHPGVMPIHEILEDAKHYYIVMEKACGGTLLEGLVDSFKDGCMPVLAVKKLMREILDAVSHLHRQGVLHRDIKPDNIVMHMAADPSSPRSFSSRARLIDFDLVDTELMSSTPSQEDKFVGTLRFNAPETLLGSFSRESDLYSVGTLWYLLMTGKFPFPDDVFRHDGTQVHARGRPHIQRQAWRRVVYSRMQEAQIDFRCDPWPEQLPCREICQRLLAFKPCERYACGEDVLAHAWFHEDESAPVA